MIPILSVFLTAALVVGPLTDTLIPIREGWVVRSVTPLAPPPVRVDTLESFGVVHARVVDTLPAWGFRVELLGGKPHLRIRSPVLLPFRVDLEEARTPSPTPEALRDTVDLLIVAPRRFREAAEIYRTLRERDGVRTEVVDLEDAVAGSPAPARALQAFLQSYARERPVRHVFLVGPVPEVPVVYTRVDGIYPPLPFYERVPTDIYFAYENPDPWNQDGDTLVGEVEDHVDPRRFVRRFHLGRLVVNTPEAFLQYAAKVDRYLHTPRPTIRYLLHGPRISASLWGSTYLRGARGWIPPDVKPVELYEENGAIPEDTFFARLRQAELVIGVAHGYNDLYEINYAPWVDARTPRFVMDSTVPPFVFYPIACELLAFDEGSLGMYALLGEGGAVAVYGMARLDFPDYAQYLALWFMQALQNGAKTLGEADSAVRENLRLYTGLFNSVPRYLFFGYTLLGDPSLPVFTRPRETLTFREVPLSITLTPAGWSVQGDLPGSRLVVEQAVRRIFDPPYSLIVPALPAPRLRLVLPDALPAETLLAARPDHLPPRLALHAPDQGVVGDTLPVTLAFHAPQPGTLRFTAQETSLVTAVVGPETLSVAYVLRQEGRHLLKATLRLEEGTLEVQQDLQVFPVFPEIPGVLRDAGSVRVVLRHHPAAWRGGSLVAGADTLALPDSGSPGLWFSPPIPAGTTFQAILTVRDTTRTILFRLTDTLDRKGFLTSRAVPGGVELFAGDTLCEAYALPGASLWLDRDALPFRFGAVSGQEVFCVRNRVGTVVETLVAFPGPPVRPPYPVKNPEFLVTQTGPVPGRFLDPSRMDVALVGQDGRIHVLDPVTGRIRLASPPESPTAEVFRDAVRVDLDGNGQEDLVFVQRGPAGFRGLWNGMPFFVSAPARVDRTPMGFDLDRDGADEVYAVSGSAILRLRGAGRLQVDTFALLPAGSWSTRPVLAPGDTALLAGAVSGSFYGLLRVQADRMETLAVVPSRIQDLAVGDVAPPPGLEIVAVSSDSVRIFSDTGQVSAFPVSLRAPDPALIDVDGDGWLDIVLKMKNSTGDRFHVAAFRGDGTPLFRSPESWEKGLSFPTPLVGCSGRMVYGNRGDHLYLWGGEPHTVFLGHKLGSGAFLSTEGALWIASFLGPLWVLETGMICSVRAWRTAYHDLYRTANAGVRDIPVSRREEHPALLLERLPGVLRVSRTPVLILPGLRLYDAAGRLLGEERIFLRGLPPGLYFLTRNGARKKVVILP